MNGWTDQTASTCFVEISNERFAAQYQGRTMVEQLERSSAGTLTRACKDKLTAEFHQLLHTGVWRPHLQVLCAVEARGISLRSMTVPATNGEQLQRVIALQIESEFPLPPQELAWGYFKPNGATSTEPAHTSAQVLVAAIKKQLLQDYTDVLTTGKVSPVFVPAGWARSVLCPATPRLSAHLELGASSSELTILQGGIPSQLRTLNWGRNALNGTAPALGTPSTINPDGAPALPGSKDCQGLEKISVSGTSAIDPETLSLLTRGLGAPCEPISASNTPSGSAAIAGLIKAVKEQAPLLRLNAEPERKKRKTGWRGPLPMKWVAAAAALVIATAAFPYLEALVYKPVLMRKLSAIKAERARLAVIDSELEFLRDLKQNQPPYLDALYMISKSAPPGARFDSVSINRKGELALRGSVKDANQIAEFRSKLLDSGLFSTIALDEQTPTPDRQKLLIRMTAQWKPQTTRQVAAALAAKEPEKPKGMNAGPMPPGPMGGPGFPPPMMTPGPMPTQSPMPGPAAGTVIRTSATAGAPSTPTPIPNATPGREPVVVPLAPVPAPKP